VTVEQNPRLYHYTTADRFASILRDGFIRHEKYHEPLERPAVWFTFAETFECTAYKLLLAPDCRTVVATLEEMVKHCGGLVRIVVAPETAPVDWDTWKATSHVSRQTASAFYKYASRLGSRPRRDWRITYVPIPRSAWLSVEWAGADQRWQPIPADQWTTWTAANGFPTQEAPEALEPGQEPTAVVS
jgi:hypothetical protein